MIEVVDVEWSYSKDEFDTMRQFLNDCNARQYTIIEDLRKVIQELSKQLDDKEKSSAQTTDV